MNMNSDLYFEKKQSKLVHKSKKLWCGLPIIIIFDLFKLKLFCFN